MLWRQTICDCSCVCWPVPGLYMQARVACSHLWLPATFGWQPFLAWYLAQPKMTAKTLYWLNSPSPASQPFWKPVPMWHSPIECSWASRQAVEEWPWGMALDNCCTWCSQTDTIYTRIDIDKPDLYWTNIFYIGLKQLTARQINIRQTLGNSCRSGTGPIFIPNIVKSLFQFCFQV